MVNRMSLLSAIDSFSFFLIFFGIKIYATEVAVRIGRLLMEELVSMQAEFVQFYGPDRRPGFSEWMRWEELEKLSPELKKVVVGEAGEELGSWMPLYRYLF